MIKVSVDESHAFDMLSILSLKNQPKLYRKLWWEIVEQLGGELAGEILISMEYYNLRDVNTEIFLLLDSMKNGGDLGETMASQVDSLNYKRFLAKQELQKRFFGDTLTEIKIGYESN